MNPAEELAAIFTNWNHEYEYNNLRFEDYPIKDGQKAVGYLSQIIKYIESTKSKLPNIKTYEKQIAQWLISCSAPYTNPNHAGDLIPQHSIELLGTLAVIMDLQGSYFKSPAIESQKVELERHVRELADAVDNDQTLDTNLKGHLIALLDHILECIATLHSTGHFDLPAAFSQLRIYVNAAQFQSTNEESKKKYAEFTQFGKDVASNAIANIAVSAPLALLGGQ